MSTYPSLVVFPVFNGKGLAIASDKVRRFEPCAPSEIPRDGWGVVTRHVSRATLKNGVRVICAGTAADNNTQLIAWEQEVGLQ